jgi:hypothetical protein
MILGSRSKGSRLALRPVQTVGAVDSIYFGGQGRNLDLRWMIVFHKRCPRKASETFPTSRACNVKSDCVLVAICNRQRRLGTAVECQPV